MLQLKSQWKDFLEKRISQIHGDDKIRLDQQIRKYFNLKAKFTKLKDDHKSLLGNLQTQTNLYDSIFATICTSY